MEYAKDQIMQILMHQFEEFNTSLNDMICKTSRFACFTEKVDNLPMWNHYAQEHKGVCLEYNIDCIDETYFVNRLFPVYYTDKLPDGASLLVEEKLPQSVFIDYFLIHKLKDWNYESEWRLIMNAGLLYNSPDDVPNNFWQNGTLIKFVLPSNVFLGSQISTNDEEHIRHWCNNLSIPVQKMKCTEYGLIAE